MLPLPDDLEWEEWAVEFVDEFELDGIPTDLPWGEFVERVQIYTDSELPELPRPDGFADWRDWARRAMMLLA